ncbi:hypothetical protein SS50377_21217 [Spironucleus salmonicida]|uniref:Uncharacterized protein n=1 Tax=Spironucleus salmonicida TaxID=348837 RepID=V6LHE9_9EUKA|nr:hypothetical protein SS50377_21217 [Spironucleus salmonicida]|eukprot:EST43990.1 Hypothetical protein SS50377_16299 [Spironucleus salmonicida]
MIGKEKIFTYRCARLNSYVQTYLGSKQIKYLVGIESILNYLFDSTSPPDVIVVVTGNQFYWLTKQHTAIKQLLDNIQKLSNHSIFTSSTALTAGDSIQTNCGFQMDEKMYMDFLTSNIAPSCIQFENQNMSELESFFKQVSIEQNSSIAADCDKLEVQNIKINNVSKSLYQLVFAHIDCGKINELVQSAGQLKSVLSDVQQAISEQNQDKINKSYKILDQKDLPSESSVTMKEIIKINRDKKQDKLPGRVYDIYLKHPVHPIINRSPYIVEDVGAKPVEGLIFAGAISQLINDQGFVLISQQLNKIETIEEDVMPSLKKFIMQNLIKSLPKHFHQTVQTTVNTLKLLIQNVQTDGSEQIFNRCISNVSISLQVRHVTDLGADIITLIYGKSFISTPQKFVLLSDFETYDFFNVFGAKVQNRASLSFTKAINKLKMENLTQKIVTIKFGILQQETNQLYISNNSTQAIIQLNQFTLQIFVEHLHEIFLNIKPKQDSKAYTQYVQMAAKIENQDQQFEYQIVGKKLLLLTSNVQCFQRYFGNFLLGTIIQLNQGEIFKYVIELQTESLQIWNEIIKFMHSNTEVEQAEYVINTNEEVKIKENIGSIQESMFNSDIDFIFKQEASLDYTDKLIEKQIKIPYQNSQCKLFIIPFNAPDFPYFSLFKNLQRFVKELGQPFSSVQVNNEQDYSQLIKLTQSSKSLICGLIYLPYVSKIFNSRSFEQIQIFSLQIKPLLLLNTLSSQKMQQYTSIGYFGLTQNPVYFSQPQKFLFDFNMQKLALQQLDNQLFISKNIFSEDFYSEPQILSFPTGIDLQPVEILVKNDRFTIKNCNLKSVSDSLRKKAFCIESMRKVQKEIKNCQQQLFIPYLSVMLQVGNIMIDIFQDYFCVDFEEQLEEGCSSKINTLTYENHMVKKTHLEQSIIGLMGCLFSEFGENKVNSVPTQAEVSKQFDHIPLPYGWVKDGQTYVSWGGEFSPVRPDLTELLEQVKIGNK